MNVEVGFITRFAIFKACTVHSFIVIVVNPQSCFEIAITTWLGAASTKNGREGKGYKQVFHLNQDLQVNEFSTCLVPGWSFSRIVQCNSALWVFIKPITFQKLSFSTLVWWIQSWPDHSVKTLTVYRGHSLKMPDKEVNNTVECMRCYIQRYCYQIAELWLLIHRSAFSDWPLSFMN